MCLLPYPSFFFFNDTSPTEIYTLSLHDALPISLALFSTHYNMIHKSPEECAMNIQIFGKRSEEHTSELQSRGHLVCRLLLEKKKKAANEHESKHKDHCSTDSHRKTHEERITNRE